MEHRALLAVGLVAGCATAAGAGGYLAVRQFATPATPVTSQALADTASSAAPVDGTEAELTPAPATTEPVAPATPATPAAEPGPVRRSAGEGTRPAPAPSSVAPARREARAVPAPTRPAPVDPPRAAPQPAPQTEIARRDPAPATTPPVEASVSTARVEPPARDTWPTRDPSTARDDRWPARDGEPAADTPLPSRSTGIEPATPPEPVRQLETVTIPADSVIGVQLETSLSSETARVEDPVRARVTRDVLSRGTVVVPAGSRLLGSVTLVEDGGRVRDRARLGVRFHTLVLADGTEVRLPTETIYRDGESPGRQSAAKIGGGAAGGAILGAILGGTRGAIIGAATGAGGGTAAAMANGRRPAELRSGQAVTVRVSNDVDAQIER